MVSCSRWSRTKRAKLVPKAAGKRWVRKEGERPMARDNRTLGRFHLVGLPPAPRGVPQIEVTFDLDANGIVNVSAKDLGTGQEQKITITASSGLSKDDVERMVKDAESNKADDKKKKELADLRNNAEGLVYTTEKSLEEYASALKPDDLAEIRAALEALKAVLAAGDPPAIKEALARLEGSAYRIADAIYAQQGGAT